MNRNGLRVLICAALTAASPVAQTPFDAYTTWCAQKNGPVRVLVVHGDNEAEATRITTILAPPRFSATKIARAGLPTVDLKTIDLIIVARDTQRGRWTEPWGTDAEAAVLRDSAKPVVGIGEGGLGAFGRLGLPVCGGRSMHGSGDAITLSQPNHAMFRAPHPITSVNGEPIHFFTHAVPTQPSHRSAFTDTVLPLAEDPSSGHDYALILFQMPRATYFAFEGSFADLTPTGRDVFSNLVLWTVWAAGQANPAFVRDGFVARKDPKRRGDRVVDLLLTRADGTPAKDTPFTVEVDDAGGKKGWPVFARGASDAAGRATIEHLTGGKEAEHYRVSVEGAGVPALDIRLKDEAPRTALVGRIPPRIGEPAPTLPLIDIVTGAAVRLEDFRGQVVLIDFWATWCVPCQEPMAHNVQLTKERADAWAGRAVILGISVDADGKKLKEHVTSRTWTNLPQLWIPMKDGKPAADSGHLFGYIGIPTAFLLDQNGIVRWQGHPTGVDVAAKIDALLAESAASRPAR